MAELADDILKHGLRRPILRFEGRILDGRHRYVALVGRGRADLLQFEDFHGNAFEAWALVRSMNICRRHMSPTQRAAWIASNTNYLAVRERGRPSAKSADSADLSADPATTTLSERAERAGVSLRTMADAEAVARVDPELARDISRGAVPMTKALRIARVSGSDAAASATPRETPIQMAQARIVELEDRVKQLEDENEHLRDGAPGSWREIAHLSGDGAGQRRAADAGARTRRQDHQRHARHRHGRERAVEEGSSSVAEEARHRAMSEESALRYYQVDGLNRVARATALDTARCFSSRLPSPWPTSLRPRMTRSESSAGRRGRFFRCVGLVGASSYAGSAST